MSFPRSVWVQSGNGNNNTSEIASGKAEHTKSSKPLLMSDYQKLFFKSGLSSLQSSHLSGQNFVPLSGGENSGGFAMNNSVHNDSLLNLSLLNPSGRTNIGYTYQCNFNGSMPIGPNFATGNGLGFISTTPICTNVPYYPIFPTDVSPASKGISYDPYENVSPASSKGISFGPYEKEDSQFLSLGRGGSVKGKEAMAGNHLIASNNYLVSSLSSEDSLSERSTSNQVKKVALRKPEDVLKPKRAYSRKKVNPCCFPTNVKNLLSTGIFEGVPVKYVSWSRGRYLKGIIKGTHYLCGCDKCKMQKQVNAYEFEIHAGCDTKHPNSHIYFPTGKSLYGIVQDLKGMHDENLYNALKTASGTPINIKNFRAWKALYEATRYKLKRIN